MWRDKVDLEEMKPFGRLVRAKTEKQKFPFKYREFRSLLSEAPLWLFRGFDALTREALLKICAEDVASDLLHWDFGPVMEMREHPQAANYLFSREAVPFHWDGAFHRVPRFLVFNCIEAPVDGGGGETLFTNTEMILAKTREEEKNLWDRTHLVYETEKKAHYGGRVRTEMVARHPDTGREVIRFAEPVATQLNPVSMTVEGPMCLRQESFLDRMRELIYSPSFCYEHQWQEGDLLVADNNTLIHGRRAFVKDCPRHLRRIQIL